MRKSFTLFKFKVAGHKVKLIFPEAWQADDLYLALQQNIAQLSKWCKWANSIDSAKKEAAVLKQMQQKISQKQGLYLVLFIDGKTAGMLDIHNLTSTSGEVGYWLSGEFQHLGIMTKSVKLLSQYAFKQLKLKTLVLKTRPDNLASQQVALNSGFSSTKDEGNQYKTFVLTKKN